MHLEILIEDSSGRILLESVVPKMIGPHATPHNWRIIAYKGIGKLPTGLKGGHDAAKRILLDRLPAILKGYGRTPGIDAVIVVVDADRRNCKDFLAELRATAAQVAPMLSVVFRLAIEEAEAWYLGDRDALLKAYPRARQDVLARYAQDAVCDTWETLADAIYPGGRAEIRRVGFPFPGVVKHGWAERIAPLMDPDANVSPSFGKLKQALIRLTAMPPSTGD